MNSDHDDYGDDWWEISCDGAGNYVALLQTGNSNGHRYTQGFFSNNFYAPAWTQVQTNIDDGGTGAFDINLTYANGSFYR